MVFILLFFYTFFVFRKYCIIQRAFVRTWAELMKLGCQKPIFIGWKKRQKRERGKKSLQSGQTALQLHQMMSSSKPMPNAPARSHGHSEKEQECGHHLITQSVAGRLTCSSNTPGILLGMQALIGPHLRPCILMRPPVSHTDARCWKMEEHCCTGQQHLPIRTMLPEPRVLPVVPSLMSSTLPVAFTHFCS